MPNLPSIEFQVTRTARGVHVAIEGSGGRECRLYGKDQDRDWLCRLVAVQFWVSASVRREIIGHIHRAIAQGNEHERKHDRIG